MCVVFAALRRLELIRSRRESEPACPWALQADAEFPVQYAAWVPDYATLEGPPAPEREPSHERHATNVSERSMAYSPSK